MIPIPSPSGPLGGGMAGTPLRWPRPRHLKPVPAVLLALSLGLGTRLSGAPGADGAEPSDFARFARTLARYPAISNLVIEAEFVGAPSPVFYQFRVQSNGFFGRELMGNSAGALRSTTMRAGGRWKDHYWYLEQEPARHPVLNTCWLEEQCTNSMAWFEEQKLELWFSRFANWGISADGIGSLRRVGDCLESRPPPFHRRDWVTRVCEPDVSFLHGQPTRITAVTSLGPRPDQSVPLIISYQIDAPRFGRDFPAELAACEAPDGNPVFSFRMKVHELTLGNVPEGLESTLFMPPKTAWGTNIVHVVHTNGQNFAVLGTRLAPMQGTEEEHLARLRGKGRVPRQYVLLLLLLAFTALPVWAFVRRNHQRR